MAAKELRCLLELHRLTEKHNALCAICSLNSREVIEQSLATVGLLRFFAAAAQTSQRAVQLIRDRSNYLKEGHLKSRVIINTIMMPFGIPEHNVCFVDDDPGQVRDVSIRLPQAHAILVPRTAPQRPGALVMTATAIGGIGQDECDQILAWVSKATTEEGAVGGGSGDNRFGACGVATLSAHQVLAPPQTPPALLRGCGTFLPKQRMGPLANWCASCGKHLDEHDRGKALPPPSRGVRYPVEYAA